MKCSYSAFAFAAVLAGANVAYAANDGPRAADIRLNAAEIREIQQTLNDRGFHAGPTDGVIGAQTRTALRDLQQKHTLEVTGTLNEASLAVLGRNRDAGHGSTAGPFVADEKVIRAVQQQLNARGYSAGPLDGMIGPQTQTAIRSFQQKEGLAVSGLLDRPTTTALGVRSEG
jgi:peptidoglycan hydrolase-like protein with peptidoglycan-binding domain